MAVARCGAYHRILLSWDARRIWTYIPLIPNIAEQLRVGDIEVRVSGSGLLLSGNIDLTRPPNPKCRLYEPIILEEAQSAAPVALEPLR
jgi:hypothetical protein